MLARASHFSEAGLWSVRMRAHQLTHIPTLGNVLNLDATCVRGSATQNRFAYNSVQRREAPYTKSATHTTPYDTRLRACQYVDKRLRIAMRHTWYIHSFTVSLCAHSWNISRSAVRFSGKLLSYSLVLVHSHTRVRDTMPQCSSCVILFNFWKILQPFVHYDFGTKLCAVNSARNLRKLHGLFYSENFRNTVW